MEDIIARVRRTSQLGILGEVLAAEALVRNGFQGVRNLNDDVHNQPFADLLAEKDGIRYLIGVKSRNEECDVGGLNASYNCVLVPGGINWRVKEQGASVDDITALALSQVHLLAGRFGAIAAWVTVPLRPMEGTYAAYFGLLKDLGNRRSIPMTGAARVGSTCLADWAPDTRITRDLCNAVGRRPSRSGSRS
ncbi:MAG: hypothetical protein EOS36_06205 [Mesorhizobium sp.]|uniref:hypothetical protein n=1 Tax=Mesorhizobium sp. TaxID=1871066 RepID=UPI000FE462EC|nr:hypothetical protein [Mesorhizobium sp.]RWD65984.1 MAG: hypothetical protein EOS36_06205 [Mesorhizobium sp.]RWE37576.1 MAG: hypothetical protein EOS79_24605 [Mesorhizobium sp.]TIU13747.1 MAG: hypothetical protein E5W44_02170 [Mesorhizobium sp.]